MFVVMVCSQIGKTTHLLPSQQSSKGWCAFSQRHSRSPKTCQGLWGAGKRQQPADWCSSWVEAFP